VLCGALGLAGCGSSSSPGSDLSAADDLSLPAAPPDLSVPIDLNVGCAGDGDCGGATPRCDPATNRCVPCLPANDNCAAGSYCSGTACVVGCKVDDDCLVDADGGAGAMLCCGHVCVDSSSDAHHCGACANACSDGDSCCAGACADTVTDTDNCGMCGAGCSGKNASWSCQSSSCAVATCAGGFADCNLTPTDGCEVNTTNDVGNCGACHAACSASHASSACTGSTCVISACNLGFHDCDDDYTNGCETADNVDNCGACHAACSASHATSICNSGACAIGVCNAAYFDCDGRYDNGCEINTSGDVNNCGGCNKKCVVANGIPTCSFGQCAVEFCSPGFANCNGVATDGCEVDTSSDSLNCGFCDNRCGPGKTCVNSTCQ
jgi:hypothetical protein